MLYYCIVPPVFFIMFFFYFNFITTILTKRKKDMYRFDLSFYTVYLLLACLALIFILLKASSYIIIYLLTYLLLDF